MTRSPRIPGSAATPVFICGQEQFPLSFGSPPGRFHPAWVLPWQGIRPGGHQSPCVGPRPLQPLRPSCGPELPAPSLDRTPPISGAGLSGTPKPSSEPEGYLGLFLSSLQHNATSTQAWGSWFVPTQPYLGAHGGTFTLRCVSSAWPGTCGFLCVGLGGVQGCHHAGLRSSI